jgi:hypothetical protein
MRTRRCKSGSKTAKTAQYARTRRRPNDQEAIPAKPKSLIRRSLTCSEISEKICALKIYSLGNLKWYKKVSFKGMNFKALQCG